MYMIRTCFVFVLTSLLSTAFAQRPQPADLVYPQLDAANSRWFFFSSACRPFGMVSLFPDNEVANDWGGGYRYKSDTIRDFSHVHEWQLSGVALMPLSAPAFDAQTLQPLFRDHSSTFSHTTETVKPGYHSVFLNRYNTKVELTASSRTGFHRYTFPAGSKKAVLFELSGAQLGPSLMTNGGFEQVSDTEILGYMVNGATPRRPQEYTVYFSAVFSRPIKTIYLYEEGSIKSDTKRWTGKKGQIAVELAGGGGPQLLMKVGISYTSEAAAAANASKEISGWQFDAVAAAARTEWNDLLGRIQIEGGTVQQQRRFYTDLWHSLQGRRVITDVDGKWTDCTGPQRTIRQVPLNAQGQPQFDMYNSDSFWGAQWTLNALWQLVYPEIAEAFCRSFLEYYKWGGLIPRGPSGGNYTYVMTGDQLTPFYVAAWQKGIRGFNINQAYEGLKKNHLPGGMMSRIGYEHKTARGGGLESYMQNGYIPYPLSDTSFGLHQDGAAITLENAYQDWCLAQLARVLNKQDDYNYFMQRSGNYRNLYQASSGMMAPKDRSGNWKTPYDPLEYEHGFEEGNGAQYTWFVPHDLDGLFMLMGGRDSAVAKLDKAFRAAQPYRFSDEHPELADRVVNKRRLPVNYSNQPSIQTAFIFNHAGAPWLTQYWSRTVIDSAYSALSPYYGYNGDEDQGLMGSLCVLMKIGLFQMTGGCEADPVFDIGSPLFSKVTIQLDPKYYKAKTFILEARNNSSANKYVKSVKLNDKPLPQFFLHQSDINRGSRIVMDMGSEAEMK